MNPYLRAIHVLEEGKIAHLLIGGFAVVLHGVSRFTPDLNVAVDKDSLDIQQLAKILQASDFECTNSEKLSALVGETPEFAMVSWADRQAPGFRLDVMTKLPVSFQELQAQAIRFPLSGIPVQIPSLDHLQLLKLATGRNQDRSDCIALRFVEKIQKLGHAALSLPKEADEEFEREILFEFSKLTPEDRLQWLSDMLSEFGKFCAL